MAWYHLRRTHFISFCFEPENPSVSLLPVSSLIMILSQFTLGKNRSLLLCQKYNIQEKAWDRNNESILTVYRDSVLIASLLPYQITTIEISCSHPYQLALSSRWIFFFFSALDRRIVSILGYDQNEDVIYGVARNRRSYLRCNVTKCAAIPSEVWLRLRDLSTTILSTEIAFVPETGHDFTDTQISGYKLVDNDGNKWGGVWSS